MMGERFDINTEMGLPQNNRFCNSPNMTDRRKAGLLVCHRLLDRTFPVAFVFGIAGHGFLDGLLGGVHRFLHLVSGFLDRGIHLVLMVLIIIPAAGRRGSQNDDNDDGPDPGAGGDVAFSRDRGVHPAGSIGRGIGAGRGTIGRPVPGDHALGADMFSAGGAAGHGRGVGMIQTIAFRNVSHKNLLFGLLERLITVRPIL